VDRELTQVEDEHSLLLIAPLPKPAKDGHDYRVLLLKRAEKSSTYQNAYVFPGEPYRLTLEVN